MLIWSLILLAIGIVFALDIYLAYGVCFRTIYPAITMLVSLGMLLRIRTLKRRGHKEALEKNNDRLRERMMEIRNSLDAIRDGEPVDDVISR